MAHDPLRQEEILEFIRANQATVPWPQIQLVLKEKGYSSDEISEAVDELFPGHTGKKKGSGIWPGLVGAAMGIVVWAILAILYHATR
jgi:hypothetical protein